MISEISEKEQADPYVIAMAIEYRDQPQQKLFHQNVCVVTEESIKKEVVKRKSLKSVIFMVSPTAEWLGWLKKNGGNFK